ncbi:hypothetical protein [Paucibacter sp. B51]|uniref:hypothetical protein n=1 Tax=Paucibacter sp. B51 TaxID=2993315 RepID=UPI0022EBD504|nr:hypothetical protein [Paucibacter sp. B51]
MKVKFLLTGEGTSDLRLVDHLQAVLIEEGFSEVSGEAPDLAMFPAPVGRSVPEKIGALIKHYPTTDIIFVHRDSDNVDIAVREKEIHDAAIAVGVENRVVPIIPICMIETWLLTDPQAIKIVAGRKSYQQNIHCMPAIRNLESVRDSKTLLLSALCEASGAEGGKLRKFKRLFPEMRARLMYDLDPQGPVNGLPSYQIFRKRVREFAKQRVEEA